MHGVRWLLLKDLQILRRSPLQAVLLVVYPILIAVLVGALVTVIVQGGDATTLISVAAAGVAFLGGILAAEYLMRRKGNHD